jgi:DNA repair protein RecO (recombination protein O)
MNIRSFSDEGIVLARRNYGEADRILVLFSKHHGRISLLAKGIRRLTSRKRGHLEVFNYLKFQAIKGKGLDLIVEAETIDDFQIIRKNLKKVSLAYYFMEVAGRITHESEPNWELFDSILDYMDKLKTEIKLKKLRLNFIVDLLTITGFWPKGEVLINPDGKLEEVIERQLNSVRVGKKINSVS